MRNNISRDGIVYCDKQDCKHLIERKCSKDRLVFIEGKCVDYKKED